MSDTLKDVLQEQYLLNCLRTNIFSVYQKHILSQLTEVYSELKFTPENFKSTLLLTHEKISNQKDISTQDILNTLNTEFLKAQIVFVEYHNDFSVDSFKYIDSGIVAAVTDTLIYVYVNNIFTKILINGNREDIDRLAKELFKIYSHEITHIEQNSKQKQIQPGIDVNSLKTNQDREAYFSNICEIDAHAREVANELLIHYGKDKKQIEKLLTTNSGINILNQIPVFKVYWDLFGICTKFPKKSLDNDAQQRIKTFNHFKRRIKS